MTQCEVDHSVFYRHLSVVCIYLIVYVENIVLTSSDNHDISKMKQHLCDHFWYKDLRKLIYFLGIKLTIKWWYYYFL